ncbi:hypothetical protein LJR125_002680 [Pseudoxanthomonas sp. LjRoot125]|uniref:hypothetical protein n=1 Tax=Pseudoxanthomonas sp. LjRoot125 TaxID=3342258 RepID=UPI003E11521F
MNTAKKVLLFLLSLLPLGCGAQVPAMTLDYDTMIILDAEDLAETGIGEAYEQLLPELKRYVARPVAIEELFDPDAPRYAIRVDDDEYVIFADETEGSDSWGRATYVFFKIVNDQLVDADVRFYAINGGNDLGGMFLTPEQAEAARSDLPRRSDWPYLPAAEGPWFGQHH